jgi:hypothetical protein
MAHFVPLGSTVEIEGRMFRVTGYMDTEDLPHVAVIERLDAQPGEKKWGWVDTSVLVANEITVN